VNGGKQNKKKARTGHAGSHGCGRSEARPRGKSTPSRVERRLDAGAPWSLSCLRSLRGCTSLQSWAPFITRDDPDTGNINDVCKHPHVTHQHTTHTARHAKPRSCKHRTRNIHVFRNQQGRHEPRDDVVRRTRHTRGTATNRRAGTERNIQGLVLRNGQPRRQLQVAHQTFNADRWKRRVVLVWVVG